MQGLPKNRSLASFSGKCGTHFLNTLCTLGSTVSSINNGATAITGIYVVPPGVSALYVRVWGAQGTYGSGGYVGSGNPGDAYGNITCLAGGGGRGYASKLLPVSPGRQIPYRIGNVPVVGGAAAGTTFFGNIQVTGGASGSGTTPGAGGVATGGDVNSNGGTGGAGLTVYADLYANSPASGPGGTGSDLGAGGTGSKGGTTPSYYYPYNGPQGRLAGGTPADGGSGVSAPSRAAVTAALPASTRNALLGVLSEAEVHNLANIYSSVHSPKILALSLGYTLDVNDGSTGGGIIYLDPIYSKLQ